MCTIRYKEPPKGDIFLRFLKFVISGDGKIRSKFSRGIEDILDIENYSRDFSMRVPIPSSPERLAGTYLAWANFQNDGYAMDFEVAGAISILSPTESEGVLYPFDVSSLTPTFTFPQVKIYGEFSKCCLNITTKNFTNRMG